MLRTQSATSVSAPPFLPSPAPKLTLTLEAVPNADFPPGSHQATLSVPARQVPVGSLADAVAKVRAFVLEHDVSGGNYSSSSGRVERDGVPYCRVSYNGRLWALGEQGRETYREMNERGEVAP
jgi:hypothetical protein